MLHENLPEYGLVILFQKMPFYRHTMSNGSTNVGIQTQIGFPLQCEIQLEYVPVICQLNLFSLPKKETGVETCGVPAYP